MSDGPIRPINSLDTAVKWASKTKGGRLGRSVEITGLDAVFRNLDKWGDGLLDRAWLACQIIAARLEAYAKTHHAWRRDSGFTDGSTQGTPERLSEYVFDTILSAGMDYDIFLELARQGKWAWLWPAMDACKGDIVTILKRELRR
jgi:hypothetical protein